MPVTVTTGRRGGASTDRRPLSLTTSISAVPARPTITPRVTLARFTAVAGGIRDDRRATVLTAKQMSRPLSCTSGAVVLRIAGRE
jgi:hypothetical protein